ncbi:Asp-tRNA(Asn)/Glu-tRNA(Gln) amidotransferase subunit GatA [Miniphocaeibacter halophilus]|uniref:Asp-tRNA(Asn)/Glu-tRNA(Gln) amidotransferase subunit GatA n=1 Tax=Miniphocaeibacter halophilus TaxID=2931922 RepID=A0AC61MSB1_9FIRM|nr:Asp-tRNA(Asn)/Glu-tRNA(Gln) amidotransferase subunit GatA [Miniphocaeibacter halophilus]QQK07739.1 Asp-tRNA(Asn)/Glu-tRNA(Gln) amidotransferase subunit GatA [Miniphocaeibacter halophilus]
MNIKELRNSFVSGEIDLRSYYTKLIEKIETKKDLNIFISFNKEDIFRQIEKLEEKQNSNCGILFGIPVTLKDNISYDKLKMTCGSKMLENFEPIFNATVVDKLIEEDAVIIGKVNMDEFAMGSSSETSYFGPTKNPIDNKLIPGGSSSGSAASVAADLAMISLGSDSGGSVRQPASYCNIYGYMPSYGTISRAGVVSMANTLDQIGILSNCVEDIVTTTNVIGGNDSKDMNSTLKESINFQIEDNYNFKNKKIGIINLDKFEIEEAVKKDYELAVDKIKSLGAEIVELDFKYLKYSTAVYSVVMSSEVSSNMSRFDGIRYGCLTDEYETTDDLYINTRSEGFGEETKRRIAMGTLFLAAENNQELYKQGQKVRKLMSDEFDAHFEKVDIILTPTTTNLPYEIGSRTEDPLSVYDSGTFNVPVNLCGLCCISIPVRKGISGSIQFIGKRYEDEEILNAAYYYERSNN